MFKLKSLNKKGFGHVEMIVFAVVILAIGSIGYLALRSSGAESGGECIEIDHDWSGGACVSQKILHCDYKTGTLVGPTNISATKSKYTLRYVYNYEIEKVEIEWGDGQKQTINGNASPLGGVSHSYTRDKGGRTSRTIKINSYCHAKFELTFDQHTWVYGSKTYAIRVPAK